MPLWLISNVQRRMNDPYLRWNVKHLVGIPAKWTVTLGTHIASTNFARMAQINLPGVAKNKLENLIQQFPRTQEDWARLGSIRDLQNHLTLSSISNTTSINEIFEALIVRLRSLSSQPDCKRETRFLQVISIAIGCVLLKDFELTNMHYTPQHEEIQEVIREGIRKCFWAIKPSSQLNKKTISQYMQSVEKGVILLCTLSGTLGSYAFTLPYHGILLCPVNLSFSLLPSNK